MIISDGINHGKLQSVILGELKKAGLKHRLKKIMLKNIKDHKTVFGAPLAKVPSCSVICCGSTLCVPLVVNEMSTVLRTNANVEGLFRKAGSQNRQKDIKRLLDAGGCVSNGHHPIDVASVLKLYLRSLPEPLISAEVQDLLLRCRLTTGDTLEPILHTLLLLPVLHVHLLHYVLELLNCIASKHKENLMDTSNLAIVMAPSIMPLPAASSAQRLEHHVALVKIFIENSQQIGHLTEELMTQLDEDSDTAIAKRKKRRSGSLNRMLNGLRKMVSGTVNTPAAPKFTGAAPILSKSASKRKFDNYEGLPAKTKEQITSKLPMRELSFTPMKMGLTERKRLRLSMIDAKSTPTINSDYSSHKASETSGSSEDLLTSSEQFFNAHDTIDLSSDMKQRENDYVRISKQEYEEIKSRVSAIENRLSREFTDVIPRVEPLQQVQDVYEQTLEEVAMLNCPTSDHLARRLSKELKIRPNDQVKIIRSPSARKIGNIRRRSKENNTKIVRHKSWASSQPPNNQNQNSNTFYPRVEVTRRERTSTAKSDFTVPKSQFCDKNFENTLSENSLNDTPSARHKYQLRKRTSLQPDSSPKQSIAKLQNRRSLNVTFDKSFNGTSNTFNSNDSREHFYQNISNISKKSPMRQKWRNAAAFFMDKTGEVDKTSGRPSVNKLRAQNAGAVAAKARMFESSSDKSSEVNNKSVPNGFARKPRINQFQGKQQKNVAYVKPKVQSIVNDASGIPLRSNRNITEVTSPRKYQQSEKEDPNSWRLNKNITPPAKRLVSPTSLLKTPNTTTPMLKKPLCTQRNIRTPASIIDHRKVNTPLKAVHISPRRKSPRQKNRVN